MTSIFKFVTFYIVLYFSFLFNHSYFITQNKRMNGIKEHILHLFYQFVNCIQHIVIV